MNELSEKVKKLEAELKKEKRKNARLLQDIEIQGIFADSAQKLRDYLEKERSEQELYSETVLNYSPDIILLFDENRRVLKQTNILGDTNFDTVESAIYNYFSTEMSDHLMAIGREAIYSDKKISETVNINMKGEAKIFELTVSPVKNQFSVASGGIVTLRDVTELISSAKKMDSHYEAKGNFLANMSHEIRTPMNAIVGMAEFILRDCDDVEAKNNAQEIKNAAKTLLTIINDVLDYSKLEDGTIDISEKPYSVPDMINEVVGIVNAGLKKEKVDFQFDIAEDLPIELIGDVVRLKQVILNLIGNAFKFTDSGSVKLSISKQDTSRNDEIQLFVSVEDTGIGIREEDKANLFSEFTQVDTTKNREREGTGLGLAICERLVGYMHGAISVESTFGMGSKFSFYIMARKANSAPIGKFNQYYGKKQIEAFRNCFVAPGALALVVDDNRVNLDVLAGMLKPYNMELTLVMSGREAIEACERNNFDIIFMDHMMPVMDGVEAMHIIRNMGLYYSTPIIAVSANTVAGVDRMFLKEGFDGYIPKPIDPQLLEDTMLRFLPPDLTRPIDRDDEVHRHSIKEMFADAVGKYDLDAIEQLIGKMTTEASYSSKRELLDEMEDAACNFEYERIAELSSMLW